MLFQVGGQGTRPTFFEMAAAHQLPSSLRAALTYSFGIMALRRPVLHRVLDYEDEFFALLMLVLETHSIRTTDASFSESLYGLRRRAAKTKLKINALHSDSTDGIQYSGIEKHQRILSVVFLVVLPYFKSKLHSVYSREREEAVRASLWGPNDERFDNTDFLDVAESPVDQTRVSNNELSSRARLLLGAKKAIAACYPWIHAGHEDFFMVLLWGCERKSIFYCLLREVAYMVAMEWNWYADCESPQVENFFNHLYMLIMCCMLSLFHPVVRLAFAYQTLYLLDATGFYSLGLHALGIHVCRATGQELMDASSRISRMRSHERERLRGPPWLKKLQGALLSCMYAVLDYSQTGLIAAVFVFKMMEWWYQSAEERMSAPTVYPPPPPPPAPKVAKEGIQLPTDKTICPLCSERRANPSVVTVSGFVFCYGCIFKYVSQYKRCPVTLIPAEIEDIRRLFHDM